MSESNDSRVALAQVLSPKSTWDVDAALAFLDASRVPLRLSSLSAKGYPQISSLWYRFHGGRFLCCTQRQSLACRQVRRDSRVGFEIAVNEPPYYGVSGQGDAAIVEADPVELLGELTDHYLEGRDPDLKAWLLSRVATEAIIEIVPHRVTSWDFRPRMSAAR